MLRPAKHFPFQRGRLSGFTLVELIAVLALVGILAVVVFPKFASTQAFQKRILTDQLSNLILQTRLHALNRDQQSVALHVIENEAWELSIVVDEDDNGDYEQTLVIEKVNSPTTDILEQESNISAKSQGFLLEFDGLGNIVAFNQQPLNSNLRLHINDQVLCVSPSGFTWLPRPDDHSQTIKECHNG